MKPAEHKLHHGFHDGLRSRLTLHGPHSVLRKILRALRTDRSRQTPQYLGESGWKVEKVYLRYIRLLTGKQPNIPEATVV